MADPYVGEIRLFAGNFAPQGWRFCDGALLAVSENEVLFNLIGATYGGDGSTTFALPDLRGRVPIHMGTGGGLSPRTIGEVLGTEAVTLTTAQLPGHNHSFNASTDNGSTPSPGGAVVAANPQIRTYIQDVPDSAFAPATISQTGGSSPHDNMMPFICINYIISLYGIFPSRN